MKKQKVKITKKLKKLSSKLNKNKKNIKTRCNKKKTYTIKMKGGDVFNHLFCKKGSSENPRPSLHPEEYPKEDEASVAMEYFKSVDAPFEVCHENLEKLLEFKKKDFSYFKFLIFTINDETYIYGINGYPKVNKHPICLLFGIIEKTDPEEYINLKIAFESVKRLKEEKAQGINEYSPEIIELNSQIFANLRCMKVKSAGSGTMIDDNTLCINNKSGHFKASLNDIEPYARQIFVEKTGLNVYTTQSAEKSQIYEFLSNNGLDSKLVNRLSGLCIP